MEELRAWILIITLVVLGVLFDDLPMVANVLSFAATAVLAVSDDSSALGVPSGDQLDVDVVQR